jgi:hypothetical protein
LFAQGFALHSGRSSYIARLILFLNCLSGSRAGQIVMHEPLLIGILFPFLSVQPWQIKGTAKMFAVGRELQKVLEGSEMGTRDFLRKFWSLGCDLQSMPEHMVRQLLFL